MPLFPQRGLTLLVCLLAAWLAFTLGRSVFPMVRENPPAVVVSATGIRVMLGEGFVNAGVYQFSDAVTPASVIKMTETFAPVQMSDGELWLRPLMAGERLDLVNETPQGEVLQRGYMSAEARMLLGIPLHPDRMSRDDWQALPGIGEKLAEAIESDRQKNGEFGSLSGLRRVRGIGPGRLKSWEKYF